MSATRGGSKSTLAQQVTAPLLVIWWGFLGPQPPSPSKNGFEVVSDLGSRRGEGEPLLHSSSYTCIYITTCVAFGRLID